MLPHLCYCHIFSTLEKRFFNLQVQLIYPSRFDSSDRENPETFPSFKGLMCLTS